MKLSGCIREIKDADWHVRPEHSTPEGLQHFTETIRDFLNQMPDYELIIHHPSSQYGVDLWDFVVIRPPA